MRLVMQRFPKPAYETDRVLGTRIVGILIYELLECGHKLFVPWQADPLTAKRRSCHECMALVHSKPAVRERAIPQAA